MNDGSTNDESTQREQRTLPTRRSFLTKTGVTAAVAAGALFGVGTASADEGSGSINQGSTATSNDRGSGSISRETRTLRAGTEYETTAFINEAAESGPTAVVVGGVHGFERAGIEAAHRIKEWTFDRGTLIVLPEADAAAVEEETYTGPDGNLNRQFPTGRSPTSPLAEEIWDLVTDADPDVVLDMHSSRGIWGSDLGPDGYGQAIFPSAAGNSRAIADRVTGCMNRNYIRGTYPEDYEFTLGNTQTGENPLLIHKVAGDLERAGYLTEVTRYNTDLDTRIEWTESMAGYLLRHHGIETSYAAESL